MMFLVNLFPLYTLNEYHLLIMQNDLFQFGKGTKKNLLDMKPSHYLLPHFLSSTQFLSSYYHQYHHHHHHDHQYGVYFWLIFFLFECERKEQKFFCEWNCKIQLLKYFFCFGEHAWYKMLSDCIFKESPAYRTSS